MSSKLVKTPLGLYKHLLRQLALLPEPMRPHYKHRIRQEYHSYSDETDTDRVEEIIQQTIKDAEWVVNKYKTSS
uniref:LYR motif-containing protein 9 n=1 Tax=Amphimedon queenslandica TaxID=400682 RepID=A0A1X7V9B3_AMPQE